MTNQIQRTDMEQIQEESQTPSVDVDVTRRDIGGAEQLQASLDEIADSADVLGFKCVHEKCGLVHNHDTTKHQAGDSFDMSDSEAASMDFNSVCHCSLNEVARRGDVSGAPSPDKANRMAPVPDSVTRALDSMY
jgi:hypothetical protein